MYINLNSLTVNNLLFNNYHYYALIMKTTQQMFITSSLPNLCDSNCNIPIKFCHKLYMKSYNVMRTISQRILYYDII